MHILGDRHFVEIPGDRTHELPPLLVHTTPELDHLERAMRMANKVIEGEEILPVLPFESPEGDQILESRRLDLAIQLVDAYRQLCENWAWGDSILDWIRQCETTFEQRLELRTLLRPDVWPHAGRASFVTLLRDKAVDCQGIELDRAVGTRLSFRQPPPLACFSDQFLIYLKSTLASAAYQAWSSMSPDPVSSLPPERFHFDVVNMKM
jgi:hypothetical protein